MKLKITQQKILTLILACMSVLSIEGKIKTNIYAISNDAQHPQPKYLGNLDYCFIADHEFAIRAATRAQQTVCVSPAVSNATYCLTYPDTVCFGQEFPIVVSIQNNLAIPLLIVSPFADIVPDPAQGPAFTPGLLFISNTPPSIGTFDPNAATFGNAGGKGAWFNILNVPASATITVTMTIQATAFGLQQYTAFAMTNPAEPVGPVLINVITAPVASADTFTACENVPVSGNVSGLVTGGSGSYSFALTGGTVGGNVTFFDTTTGDFTFTPTPGFVGAASFQFTGTDLVTGCTTNPATITINYTSCCSLTASSTSINDCVNQILTGNLASLITGVSGVASFAPLGAPVGGGVIISPSGIFTFTPTTNFSGPGGFSFQVTDSGQCTATASVGITILNPVAQDDFFTNCDGSQVTGNLSSLVSDGFPPYTFSLVPGSAVGGAAAVAPDGSFVFTPTPGFNGLGGFSYLVTDSNGCTDTGQISIFIGSPITSPTAITTCNNNVTGNLNLFVTGGLPPFIFDGPVGAVSCTGGSVTINSDGTFSFTAPTGFTGPCTFVFEVFDQNDCTSTGAITISSNVFPVAQDASYSACRNVPISQTLQVSGGIPPLTFSIVTPPTNGAITAFNPATGAFTYTPNVGFVGNDSFQFQVTDSSTPPCQSNIATISLVINECCVPVTDPFLLFLIEQFGQLPV